MLFAHKVKLGTYMKNSIPDNCHGNVGGVGAINKEEGPRLSDSCLPLLETLKMGVPGTVPLRESSCRHTEGMGLVYELAVRLWVSVHY